jgi:hypothetical protein
VQGADEVFREKPLVYQTPPKLTIAKDIKPQNK